MTEGSRHLRIANEVLADLAGRAALECYGVVGMSSPDVTDGIATLLPNSRFRRGIVVKQSAAGVHVDLYVIIEYGTNISAVSKNLIDQVTFALKNNTAVKIDAVEVKVQGVRHR